MVKGIDPELEQQVTDIKGAMLSGSVEALDAPPTRTRREHARDGILLGKDLATKLGVSVGDTVSVLTPQEMLTPNGLTLRPARLLRVAGIFSLGLYEFDSTYGYVSIDVAKRLFGKDQVDLIQLRVDDLVGSARRSPARSSIASAIDYAGGGLVGDEPLALHGAVARKDGRLADDRPHRHGRRAEHRRVARPAGDGEAPRHRHPEDDGRERQERDDHLHDAGADHRHRRHDRRGGGRLRRVVRARSLQGRARAGGRLPGVVRAVQGGAARLRARDRRGRGRLLRRDDLPVAPGREARSRAGAAGTNRCNHEDTKTRRMPCTSAHLRAFVVS